RGQDSQVDNNEDSDSVAQRNGMQKVYFRQPWKYHVSVCGTFAVEEIVQPELFVDGRVILQIMAGNLNKCRQQYKEPQSVGWYSSNFFRILIGSIQTSTGFFESVGIEPGISARFSKLAEVLTSVVTFVSGHGLEKVFGS
ncbi:hypothetical protein CSKR_203567, partial [Clonorchis sinensis]